MDPSSSKARPPLPPTTQASNRIHRSLCPRIAVLSSSDVNEVLHRNGFADFAECLRPFEESVQGVTVRTSQLESKQCSTFPVRFDPIEVFSKQPRPSTDLGEASTSGSARSPPPASRNQRPEEVLDQINARVAAGSRAVEYDVLPLDVVGVGSEEGLRRVTGATVEQATPWFADARDAILQTRSVSRHETFGHPVAVLLAVSTRSPDPLNAFSSLFSATQPQNCDVFQSSPYIDPNVLRYYVLLHDQSQGTDIEESKVILESVKKIYGLNCCILPINSATESHGHVSQLWQDVLAPGNQRGTPAPTYAQALDDEDVRRLKGFIRELVAQGLVPWMERCVSQWNESIAASRKGLTGRLFGAGKKFFGSNAPMSRSGSATPDRPTWNAQGSFYPHAALEAQTRRLADFAFLTHDYKLAAATYDIGRKDYGNDKAFQYAAGATEMFGLSHLMMMMGMSTPPIDVDSYLASACTMYRMASPSSTSSSSALLRPVKATLLYYEAYRALDFYRPAPVGLVRAAQDPEADLEVMAAMLLEQAAFADLHTSPQPSLRKWALHLTMAGHKYRQCGAKQLSLRCFRGAKAAYVNPPLHVKQFLEGAEAEDDHAPEVQPSSPVNGWTLIQDHVELELGRQAFNEGHSEEAVEHFLRLLRPHEEAVTAGEQQSLPLHETYVKELLAAYESLPDSSRNGEAFEPEWALFRAEHSRVDVGSATVSMGDDDSEWAELEKSSRQAGLQADSSQGNVAAVNEPFTVTLHLQNPLATELALGRIQVHVTREDTDDGSENNITVDTIEDIILAPLEEKSLQARMTISDLGKYRVSGVSYTLAGSVPFKQSLIKQGKRLNTTREQRISKEPQYAPDETLSVNVREARPSLQVNVEGVPEHLGLGEEREVGVTLRNVGKTALRGLRMFVDRPEAVRLGAREEDSSLSKGDDGETLTISNSIVPFNSVQVLPDDVLEPSQTHSCKLLVRGCSLGVVTTRLLFAFEGGDPTRTTITTEVYPVVDIGVDISPAAEGFAYELSISAVNLSPNRETIKVTDAVFVSPRWRAVEQQGSSETSLQSALGALPPMQSCRAVVAVQEAEGISDPTSLLDHPAGQLRTTLIGRDIDRSAKPGSVTLQVSSESPSHSPSTSPFLASSRAQWRRTQLSQQYPTLTTPDQQRIFTLYQPEDLDVQINWASSTTHGQVFIFGLSLGPSSNHLNAILKSVSSTTSGRSLYEETAQQKAALLSNLTRSPLATEVDPLMVDIDVGDSQKSSSPTKTVTFQIRNMSTTRRARCVIDLDSSIESEVSATSASGRKASWIGRLTLRSGVIEPRGEVRLSAVAGRPESYMGEVELGDWSIKTDVLDAGEETVLQSFSSGRLRSGKVVGFA